MNTTNDFKAYYVTFASDDADAVNKVAEYASNTFNGTSYTLRDNLTPADEGSANKNRSFSAALLAMKCGKGARLPHWKEDVVIRAQFPDEHSKMTHPYLYVQSRFGCVPWKETYVELFSEHWEIVD